MTNKMQLCRIIYCSLTALHVSSDIFAHHQKHLNCIYSFWYCPRASLPAAASCQHTNATQDTIRQCAVSNFYKMTYKMQLWSIIYCSLTALHVSSDIFAHHQEHLKSIYSFWYCSRVSLPAADSSRQRHTWTILEAVNTFQMLLMMSENIARNM